MLGMSIVIIWDYLNSLNSVDLWCFEMLTTLINEMFILMEEYQYELSQVAGTGE